MTADQLEERLEEWARWVQGGSAPAQLGYGSTSPGFGLYAAMSSGILISSERQIEVEAAVAELQILGHGIMSKLPGKWIQKPQKRYSMCSVILRAEYRAHPKFGDARYEGTGNAIFPTLSQLGLSERSYYTKLKLSKEFMHIKLN